MDTIFIQQLEVATIIGVYEQERLVKQPIVIDIEIQYDTTQARMSDNLKYALDYNQLCIDIYDFVSQSSYQLIETLVHAIVDRILENKIIKKVVCSLSKPQALSHAKNVGIRITKEN